MKSILPIPKTAAFVERVRRLAARFPDMPREEVVLTRLAFHVFTKLEQALDETVSPFGLSTGGWMTLVMLYCDPDHSATPSDLSRTLTASPANVTRLTDELVRQGWLTRRSSAEDRRVIHLTLTPAGEALVVRILPETWKFYRQIWAGVTTSERTALDQALCKLAAGMDDRRSETDDARRRNEDSSL